MKRKFYMIFMTFMTFTITACTDENPNYNTNIPGTDQTPEDKNEILADIALGQIEINEEIVEDFNLVTSIDGYDIVYTSSSESALVDGDLVVVTREEYDQNIIITASVTIEGKTYEKTFNLIILKIDLENPIREVLALLDIPSTTKEDFILPTNVDGVEIIWKSNNSNIKIENGNAVVTQSETDVTVILTANAKYEMFEGSKTYDVKVLKIESPIDGILDDVEIPVEVEENFTIESEIEGFDVTWTSSNEDYIEIINDEAIVNRGIVDTNIVLTANVVYSTFEESKTFTVKVIGDDVNPLEGLLDQVTVPTEVTSDFNLQTTVGGYDIEYVSNNSAISISDGVALVTQSKNDVKLSIIATIRDGDFISNKSFDITVLKIENPIDGILDNFELPTEVTGDFDLVTNIDGYNVVYKSLNDAITIEGDKAIVTRSKTDVNVSIIVEVSELGFTETKSFNVLIKKVENTIPDVLEKLELPTEVSSNFTLQTLVDKVSLIYTSNSSAISIVGGNVNVTRGAKDNIVTIILTATDGYYDATISFEVKLLAYTMEEYISGDTDMHSEMIKVVSENLYNDTYYTKRSEGNTKGSYLFGTQSVEQSILNVTSKYLDTTYLQSQSLKVKGPANTTFYHNAYYQNDNVNYVHSGSPITNNTATSVTQNTYYEKYGVLANGYDFTGYTINENTINSSEYITEVNGLYQFKFTLNSNAATNMIVQMHAYADLNSVTFSSIELTMIIDKDFNIISYDQVDEYTTNAYTINVTMKQTLSTTITRHGSVDSMVVVPDNFLFN